MDILNRVVTILSNVGEFVGKLEEMDDESYTIIKPRALIQTQEGFGFAPSVAMSAQQDVERVTFNRSLILCCVLSDERIVKAWQKATTGLVIPA